MSIIVIAVCFYFRDPFLADSSDPTGDEHGIRLNLKTLDLQILARLRYMILLNLDLDKGMELILIFNFRATIRLKNQSIQSLSNVDLDLTYDKKISSRFRLGLGSESQICNNISI